MNFRRVLFAALAAATFAAADFSSAAIIYQTLTKPAEQDTYIRSGSGLTGTNYDGDLLRIASGHHILFQFDLSDLGANTTITGAHLRLYDTATASTVHNIDMHLVYPKDGATEANLVYAGAGGTAFDKDGMHEQYVNYTSFAAATGTGPTEYWNEDLQTSLNFSNPTNKIGNYHVGKQANNDVLEILNTAKETYGHILILGWRGSSASGVFGDIESGNPPLLVLETETIPEPATYAILGFGCFGLLALRRRAA